jgi:hypothetical protein
MNKLSYKYAKRNGQLSLLSRELQALQLELETIDSILYELRPHVGQERAAIKTVAGEKVLLDAQRKSTAKNANVAASTLCKVKEA